ncbi:hypothetical protein Nepgr_000819 [Nepenthes gracilis]|uniref:TOPLESS zinc finger domain-containing protein n=1 Tax=Nepenthes gracilis TaxID=150966 RepID=A0AAD3P243_NEPGR|nr:hypothetical protein Nepgr_000819 [Nepenthes gracilis]
MKLFFELGKIKYLEALDSLNWQHSVCRNPKPRPVFRTLYANHYCNNDTYAQLLQNYMPYGAPASNAFRCYSGVGSNCVPIFMQHYTSASAMAPSPSSPPTWFARAPSAAHLLFSPGTSNPGFLTHQAEQLNAPLDLGAISKSRPQGTINEVLPLATCLPGESLNLPARSTIDLPMTVGRTLSQGSSVMSMDFHPIHQTLLLVGTNTGDIGLWEVCSKEKLILKSFMIDAHYGGVNGLAFAIPMGKISLITCGDDKNIRIWDASNGAKLIDLVGHEAPVYSVCPQHRHDTHFILSTSVYGKINVWLYDVMGPRIEYTTPNSGFFLWLIVPMEEASTCCCLKNLRLFSFGTSKVGESYIAEWNEGDGGLRRTYQDIDNANILATFDADGGLPANPCIRFNKDGSLLAVSSEDKGFKVLANIEGCQLLYKNDAKIPAATQIEPEVEMQNGEVRLEEIPVSSRPSARFLKIEKSNQLQLLQLVAPLREDKISRLMYTNSGTAIFVLLAYGVNLVWRWPRTVTTKVYPVLWHPSSGLLMTNDMSGAKPEGAVPCLALATNDSYCISASGGKASLYSMSTAKLMESFADPPPAATSLAFLPGDNNVIVIGLDDSNILIYNICFDKCIKCLFLPEQILRSLCGPIKHGTGFGANTSGYKCVVGESSALISGATFSCDGQLVYTSFKDGTVCILAASDFNLLCSIKPSAYLPSAVSTLVAMAAHPHAANQFVFRLTTGEVYVFKPLEAVGKWDATPVLPAAENKSEADSSSATPLLVYLTTHTTPEFRCWTGKNLYT